MKKLIALFLLVCFLFPTIVFAHPGGTDSKGGHYNRSTGEYHYHHGHSAHQHTNGICPYNFDDTTEYKSSESNNSKNHSSNAEKENKTTDSDNIKDDPQKTENQSLVSKIIKWVILGIFLLWVGGSLVFSIGMVLISLIYTFLIDPIKNWLEKQNIHINKKSIKNFLLIFIGGIIATFIFVGIIYMDKQNIFSLNFWKNSTTIKDLLTCYLCFTGSTLPISFIYLFTEKGKGSFLGAIFWYFGVFVTSICNYYFSLSNLLCCIVGFDISFLLCWAIYSIIYPKK